MEKNLRVAILGGGTIARLVAREMRGGNMPGISLVGIAGRSAESKAKQLAAEFAVPYGVGREALLAWRPDVVLEAASHDAVREHLVPRPAAGRGD